MKRAPRWLEDRGERPYKPLRTPTWDVKLQHQTSFLFTLALLGIGMMLNVFVMPILRALKDLLND